MYRFRKIEDVLGEHKELEKQEIYFSDISTLNDPMEGFREYYWQGDEIVWQNFFKHYLLCLERICHKASLDKAKPLASSDIPVFFR